jgi:hypothetical protein
VEGERDVERADGEEQPVRPVLAVRIVGPRDRAVQVVDVVERAGRQAVDQRVREPERVADRLPDCIPEQSALGALLAVAQRVRAAVDELRQGALVPGVECQG